MLLLFIICKTRGKSILLSFLFGFDSFTQIYSQYFKAQLPLGGKKPCCFKNIMTEVSLDMEKALICFDFNTELKVQKY